MSLQCMAQIQFGTLSVAMVIFIVEMFLGNLLLFLGAFAAFLGFFGRFFQRLFCEFH
jgi:hypothetical protein